MRAEVRDVKTFLSDIDLYAWPIDLKEIRRKLKIEYQEADYDGFDGLLIVLPDRQMIGVNSKIVGDGRKSFTCAHELGHYFYDIQDTGAFRCTRDDTGYGKQALDVKEIRANAFASELLMPTEFAAPRFGKKEPSWEVIKEFAKEARVSLQAAASRYIQLTPHSCWLVMAKEGRLRRYVKQDFNDFQVDLNRSFRGLSKAPADWTPSLANSWLYDNRKTRDKEILVLPTAQNSFGESMILLWNKNNTLLDDSFEEPNDNDDPWNKKRRW